MNTELPDKAEKAEPLKRGAALGRAAGTALRGAAGMAGAAGKAARGAASNVTSFRASARGKRLHVAVRGAIGIDVGARTVKAVQLGRARWGDGQWQVWATAEVPRAEVSERPAAGQADSAPAPHGSGQGQAASSSNKAPAPIPAGRQRPLTAPEVGRLLGTLERQGFAGDRVVLAAPPDRLSTSVLDLPPRSSQAPIEQIARMELARAHRFAPDQFEMGCWDLPAAARAAKATPAMAVACTHADALALIDPFEAEGLDVVALDVLPCALARACVPLIGADSGWAGGSGITGIVDIGWSTADLILLNEGVVIYTRSLADSGISRLYQTLGTRLRLEVEVIDYLLAESGLTQPPAAGAAGAGGGGNGASSAAKGPNDAAGLIVAHFEAAVQELQASLKYARHQYPDTPVSQLLLVGGGACIRGVGEHFSRTLGMAARTAAPADLTQCAPHVAEACTSPALTAALGLAQSPEA
jgi:Tfp pilus assembly PilM family ATPase